MRARTPARVRLFPCVGLRVYYACLHVCTSARLRISCASCFQSYFQLGSHRMQCHFSNDPPHHRTHRPMAWFILFGVVCLHRLRAFPGSIASPSISITPRPMHLPSRLQPPDAPAAKRKRKSEQILLVALPSDLQPTDETEREVVVKVVGVSRVAAVKRFSRPPEQ